jgi:hypothetical protein
VILVSHVPSWSAGGIERALHLLTGPVICDKTRRFVL